MRQKAATTATGLIVVVTRGTCGDPEEMQTMSNIKSLHTTSREKEKQALKLLWESNPKTLTPKIFQVGPLIKKINCIFYGLKRPMVREVGEREVRISVHKLS